MQVINYLFVAVISAFIGMFMMAWYDLDHPITKEKKHETVNIENNYYLKEIASKVSFRIACWGNHGEHLGRGEQVKKMIKDFHYLKMNNTGQPAHPLYLPASLQPIPW